MTSFTNNPIVKFILCNLLLSWAKVFVVDSLSRDSQVNQDLPDVTKESWRSTEVVLVTRQGLGDNLGQVLLRNTSMVNLEIYFFRLIIGKTKNLGQIIIVRDLGVKRPSTVKKTSVIVKNASLQRVLVNTLSDWIGIFLAKRDQHGSV